MKRLVICLALAACAPKPPVQVSVPVATPCIAADAVPTRPEPLSAMPSDANAALSLTLDKLLEWKAYGVESDGKLRACSVVH